jgi:prevent-host-death family protein
MQTIGAYEAKTHFSALLEQVEKGERVIITKHGRPIVTMSPVEGTDQMTKRAAIEKIKALAKTRTLGGLDWKSLRDEGRR